MKWAAILLQICVILLGPWLLPGIINRVKAWWGGRRGPPLLQPMWDARRLLRKHAIYSIVTSEIFRIAPLVIVASSLIAALIAPVVPGFALVSFNNDFVYFAYLLALGRVFLMLAALDTGSAFEGMGAAREATFSAFLEPAFFLAIGSLALATGHGSFANLMRARGPEGVFVTALCAAVLFIALQIESARLPVDDPSTHLELTMIHEVMILDTSGPDLALLQYAAGLKLCIFAGLIAALLNPFALDQHVGLCVTAGILLLIGVAVTVGCVESLVARFKMRLIPQYALLAVGFGLLALLLSSWRSELI